MPPPAEESKAADFSRAFRIFLSSVTAHRLESEGKGGKCVNFATVAGEIVAAQPWSVVGA